MRRSRSQVLWLFYWLCVLLGAISGRLLFLVAWVCKNYLQAGAFAARLDCCGAVLAFAVPAVMLPTAVAVWCVHHKLQKGLRYALAHALMCYRVNKALLQIGTAYGVENYNWVTLPKIEVEFTPDMSGGTLKVQSLVKFNEKLENVNLSPALGRYVVEEQYATRDSNQWIYEFYDASIATQIVFSSFAELKRHTRRLDAYKLFMDRRRIVPLSSMLLVGATGSGKSYGLHGLILQLLSWKIRPKLYFADLKASSVALLGKQVSPEHTAEDEQSTLALLGEFHAQLLARKQEMQGRLKDKIDGDYRNWKLPAHIFIFDELAVFQTGLSRDDQKIAAKYLRDIILLGRQLGFFLWAVLQKSDSNDIPTTIRDNLVWKIVLGNAANTTYMTAFEHAADLPKPKFAPGEGLFTYQGITREPQIMSFPTLNFDVLAAIKELRGH